MHILFADDSKAISFPIIAFLEQQGYRVTYVQNGLEAINAYRNEPPDLVLMDVVMPVMDGVEATRQIKAMGEGGRWIPVILMTTLSENEDIISGFNAGADDYLIKPIISEVLHARMRSMKRIASIQDRLVGILENVYEAILTLDEKGLIRSYNPAAERIFGYKAEDVLESDVAMLIPAHLTEANQALTHDIAGYLYTEATSHVGAAKKIFGQRKTGEVFPIRLSLTEMKRQPDKQFIALMSDISEEESARARIEFLALHDSLTSLPNRTKFNEALELACANAPHSPSALLFIDLDGFKPINDAYGHDAGDEALMTVARRMRQALANRDILARLGGDEFVVLLSNCGDLANATAIANRLIEAISAPMNLLNHHCKLGASVGLVMIPQESAVASVVLNVADQAMYAAKRAGKGCVIAAQV